MDTNEYKKKCEWLAKFYAEAGATGRQMQMRIANGNWITNGIGPNADCDPQDWRLKPEPEKAWVVWDGKGVRGVFNDHDEADKYCEIINGVFHEITRPEPQ